MRCSSEFVKRKKIIGKDYVVEHEFVKSRVKIKIRIISFSMI